MKKTLVGIAALAALIATPARAADLSHPMYTKAPPPQVFSWTGLYIGANIGSKWATTDGSVNIGPTVASLPDVFPLASATNSTVIGGGQIGYNWQTGPFVLGVEGDIDAQHWSTTHVAGASGHFFFVPGDNFTIDSHWQASLRGRIGYAWDRVLLYATGGAAWTQARVGTNFVASGVRPSSAAIDDMTLTGGTAGGGLEYAVTNQISLAVEGRWTGYGRHTFNGGAVLTGVGVGVLFFAPVTQTINLSTTEMMGKINFRF